MAETNDWRGTPIEVGQTVIYGAPVGRSIAMVEAVVDGFTDSGRVWLLVRHRAYGGWGDNVKQRVHVGADRLTVVLELPPTELPLETDKAMDSAKGSLERLEKDLAALDAGGRAPHYWRETGYGQQPLSQEEADKQYRAYLTRRVKTYRKKVGQ